VSALDLSGAYAVTAAAYSAGDIRRLVLDKAIADCATSPDPLNYARGAFASVDVPFRTPSEPLLQMPRLFTRDAAASAAASSSGSDTRVARQIAAALEAAARAAAT